MNSPAPPGGARGVWCRFHVTSPRTAFPTNRKSARIPAVTLVSLREGLDLATPAGRLLAHVLASVAAYETEVRAERVLAGQAAARARGVRWGGRKPGTRIRVSVEKEQLVRQLKDRGQPIAAIARLVGLSRPTVYRVLETGPCPDSARP